MIDNKKQEERKKLHNSIWKIAEELRGSVDGWDFKQYVLVTLFYRFISENITKYINDNEREAGNTDFDLISDQDAINSKETLIKEKGFFILNPKSSSKLLGPTFGVHYNLLTFFI